MQMFSVRNGYFESHNGIKETDRTLRERIWASFYKKEYVYYDTLVYDNYTTGIEDMMIEMGVQYEFPRNSITKSKNADKLYKYVVQADVWFRIYDFIEKYIKIKDKENITEITMEFNRILEEEVSAYRILDGIVVPIINEGELNSVKKAIQSEYEAVRVHLLKALELFSDRQKPDYENSIKESISAVEAMCNIITESEGKNATLGNTIKKLKEYGINIHPAMERAFQQLYGYTSDSGGIRHGAMEFINVPSEDAKYMLISCSAFVNYLVEKWIKIRN